MSYIANDSYALTINGGTSGTPETMVDVQGDDVTNGWGMVNNPVGTQYGFIVPTEWGNATTVAEHAFTASNEQWYWIGDNAGGHAVASTHFPFRVIGNATDTGSFIISNVVIVNTGTTAEFDCSNSDIDTLEIDLCTMIGLASFEAPASGGTSRFCTNTTFVNCGKVTSNLCDMSGNKYLTSTAAADDAALEYDETLSASKELTTLDDSSFSQGANAHHAITFGTGIDEDITLTGCAFDGFDNTADANGATFEFLATSATLTLNLVGCTVDGSDATTSNIGIDTPDAGTTVTVSISVPISFEAVDKTDTAIQSVLVTCYLVSDDSEVINSTTTAGGFATTSFGGTTPADVYYRYRKSSAGSQKYVNLSGFGTILAGVGLTIKRSMTEDTIADPSA